MQQLSAMDAVFLSMETPETPSHIGGLAILDPSTTVDFSYTGFIDFIEARLAVCPRFMWTVQEVPFGLDRPYWVESDGLAPRDQVRRIALPAPGGPEELSELTGMLFERPLDRNRPLWEMYFIEGIQGGRVALLWKVHHCLMDGASGAGLTELLFDLQPEPAERPLVPVDDNAHAGAPASLSQMAYQAVRNGLELPAAQARHLGRALPSLGDLFGSNNAKAAAATPRASFNGKVGTRRAVAWSRISLDDTMSIKNELGVKLNDVVLAITGGAMRHYLESRSELPEASLVASVPVSTRSQDDKSIGNQISEVNVYWGTDIECPVSRVSAIHAASHVAKEDIRAGRGVDFIGLFSETIVPGALQLFMRLTASASESMPLPANAVVSNVRMTPVPVYIAGAKLEGMVPISLLAPTQGVNITLVSYCGELHFGITADPDLLPEPWLLAGAIPKALLELQESLSGRQALSA
ncbi:MAG: wax ester/triacylglycerol synthase family O-acyltransferase [Deltaproteobacteria bacterium]|nr:wax ester/triacylglycerol synthase family O-acyltransferase [Deltaproteobacteria bacterium]